jgi:hypothetical protein
MMVLRHILAALCEVFSGGQTEWPAHSPYLNNLDFIFGKDDALYDSIVDACQIIRNCAGICELMRQSIMRRVEA